MNLKEFPFYKELDAPARDFLKTHLKPIDAPKETLLFFEGDICDSILFLTSGSIRLSRQVDDEDITLYDLNAGEQCMINTASTMSQTPAIGTAVTLTNIEGYILDMYSLKELAHNSNIYQSYLFSIYGQRMNELIKLADNEKLKNLDKKIISCLLSLAEKEIEATEERVSNELSISVSAISKILKSLENDGIIRREDTIIKLL